MTSPLESARCLVTQQTLEEQYTPVVISALVVGIAWTRQHPEALKPGREVFHPTIPDSGEIISVSEEAIEGDFAGERKNFPLNEVALSGAAIFASKGLIFGSECQVLAMLERRSEALIEG